jgi:DNA replication protein DnaC
METLQERMERMQAERAARIAAAPDCPTHPGEKTGYCDPCMREMDEQRRARQREFRVAQSSDQCDAKFPARYRKAIADHPEVLTWIEGFHKNPSNSDGLLLMGKTGTGKTYQAYGALRAAVTQPRFDETNDAWESHVWRAMTMADLNANMRPGGDRDPEQTLKVNRSVDLLLLDDLGAARGSEWVEDHLYRLINGRYERMLPAIFTTNLEPAALRDAVGDRIASRLVESCRRVVLTGEDRRRVPK